MLRIVGRVALGSITTLVLAPFLVNVITGGEAAERFGPYARFLWPMLGTLTVVAVVLES